MLRKSLAVSLSMGLSLLSFPTTAFSAETLGAEEMLFSEMPSVVSASKVAEKLSDAPGVISVVTKDELKRFGGTTLADILTRVPGLAHSTVYFSERSIAAIRGAQFRENSGHVLLLVNSRPLRDNVEGGIVGEVLESFPVNVIERIEVIKGPGSVLYGSSAFSGVINVITAKAEEDGVRSTVAALGGERGGLDQMATAKIKKGDFSMVLAGKFHEKPDWDVNLEFRQGAANRKLSHEFGDRGPGFYGEMAYKNLRLMTGYTRWQTMQFQPNFSTFAPGGAGATPLPDFYGTVRWTKRWADLGYSQTVADNWRMDFNVTYVSSLLDTYVFPYAKRTPYDVTGEWANFITASDKMKVVVGGTFNYMKTKVVNNYAEADVSTPLVNNRVNLLANDRVQRGYGAYAQADYWLVPEKTKGIAGLQLNAVQGLDQDWVPRAGLIQYLTSNVNIKALYSDSYRAPSGNERFRKPPVLVGKEDIKSEKVRTYDLGVNYNTDRVQTGLNFFYSRLSNLIRIKQNALTIPPFGAVSQYQNRGEITARGAEWEGKLHATRQLLLMASALWQKSQDETGARNVSPIANTSGKLGVSYAADNGLTLSLHNQYQGKLDRKYVTTMNPSPGDYNILDLNARLDLDKFTGRGFAKGLSVLLRVDNALDREIWLPNWGSAVYSSIPFIQGRTVYGGVELSF